MKLLKIEELRKKTSEELRALVLQFKEKAFSAKFKLYYAKKGDSNQNAKIYRRHVATIKTILCENEAKKKRSSN